MKLNQQLQSNRGFALMQVIMAAGLVAIIGYAVTSIATSSALAQKRAETSADHNAKMAEMSGFFSSAISCTALLGDAVQTELGLMKSSAGAGVDVMSMAGRPVIEKTKKYGAIEIRDMNVRIESAALGIPTLPGNSVHRGVVTISTGPINQALGFYLNKKSEHSLLFTLNDGTGQLTNCYTEAMNVNTVQTSCEMLKGQYDVQSGKCNLEKNDEIARLKTETENLNEQVVQTNIKLQNVQSQLQTSILNAQSLFSSQLFNTTTNMSALRNETIASFQKTAERLDLAFSNISTLESQHIAMTQTAANLNTDIAAKDAFQKVALSGLTGVVNVNDSQQQSNYDNQNLVLNNLENTMVAKGNAQQVAVNQLDSTVNINKTNMLAVKNEIDNKMKASGQAHQEAFNSVDSNVNASHADLLAVNNKISNKLDAQGQSQIELASSLDNKVKLEETKQLEVNNKISTEIEASDNARVKVKNNLTQTINTSKEDVKASLDQLSKTADAQDKYQQQVNEDIKAKIDANDAAAAAALATVNNGVSNVGGSIANVQGTTGNITGQLQSAVSAINTQSGLKGQLGGIQNQINSLSGQLSALGR